MKTVSQRPGQQRWLLHTKGGRKEKSNNKMPTLTAGPARSANQLAEPQPRLGGGVVSKASTCLEDWNCARRARAVGVTQLQRPSLQEEEEVEVERWGRGGETCAWGRGGTEGEVVVFERQADGGSESSALW